MIVYTFNIAQLRNAVGKVGFQGRDRPKPHPFVARGWLDETAERAELGRHQIKGWLVRRSLTQDGAALIESFYGQLGQRFPGERWYTYNASGVGRVTIYNIGIDVPAEWRAIFGPRAGWPTEPHKMPDGWRPWTASGSLVPTCFIDTQDEHYPWVDSMGVVGMGNHPLTMYAAMLYALPGPNMNLTQRIADAGLLSLFRVDL